MNRPLSKLIRSRLALAIFATSLSATVTGCSKRPADVPVTGHVTVNGKPAAGATVVFHPVSATGPEVIKPTATVGPDGTFRVTLPAAADATPAGDYKVTVEQWLSPVKRAGDVDGPPVNYLPSKYGKPETSGLTAQVQAETTELKTFDLKK